MNLLRILFLVRRGPLGNGGFLNGGSSFPNEWNSATPLLTSILTSFVPQFYLFLSSFNLNLTSASSRISNHGLEITVYMLLVSNHLDGPAIRNANRGNSRESIRANQFAEKSLSSQRASDSRENLRIDSPKSGHLSLINFPWNYAQIT